MNILMVTGESNPFIKSGGLADVVYSLSKELVKKDHQVSIILPFYKKIKDNYEKDVDTKFLGMFEVKMNWRYQYCGVFERMQDGIRYLFIDNEQYYGREGLYGFDDDIERFAFFDLAVLEMICHFQLKFDILHMHDWHAGMIPLLMHVNYKNVYTEKTKTVITIHNPAFRGMFGKEKLLDFFNLSEEYYYNGTVEFDGACSFLKTGLMVSEFITTVSPTHAQEILEGSQAYGLEDVIKYKRESFKGIVNGIDYDEFNPKEDKLIKKNYSVANIKTGKFENKKYLCESFNLQDPNRPLFGLVSRLTWQKGIDLILDMIPYLVSRGANVIILGAGEYNLEQRANFLQGAHKNHVGVYFGYNNELAHQIYAGSDFFMMPSLFEPCGIGQMIAMRYGTLPLVRNTGGLKDTVIGYDGTNASEATGFSFYDYSVQGFIGPLSSALDIYYTEEKLKLQLAKNAMKSKNDWSKSADEYLTIYRSISK